MKKKILILITCVLIVAGTLALCACSEKMSKDAIATDVKGASVEDNGGMAVKYGNYIYFINGFAGESALNTFGDVLRGSICRTTLKNGVPDYTKTQVVVPKNAFGEDKTYGGIYIVNNYIYFNTTSVDKDSKRNYKTSQGVLMRAALDGSKTEKVKDLDDNDITLYAGNNSNYLVYLYDNVIYSLNAKTNEIKMLSVSNAKPDKNKKKDKDADNSQTVASYKFGGDYVVYTLFNYADANNYSADTIVWAFNLKNGKHKQIASSDIYNGNTDRETLYATTPVSVIPEKDGFVLYYSKKGNNSEKNDGFYSRKFKDDLTPADKEIRYTHETTTSTYSQFAKLSNGYTLAFNAKFLDVFSAAGEKVKFNNELLRLTFGEKDVTLVDIIENNKEVFAYYLLDNKLNYIRLFDKNEDGSLKLESAKDGEAVLFFSAKFDTSYTTYDIIGNIVYYFNDDKLDNAYYYAIPAFDKINKDTKTADGKILGIIDKKDLLSLTREEAKAEESK